ncbi:MAG: GFA family protein [Pseudomonadota bacterium]
MTQTLSGGCQCGSVRFRARNPKNPSICHCRMCQKAFAGPFAALVECQRCDVEWTRGKPSYFKSSDAVRRGFCNECGTPLTYEHKDGIELAICAFDEPDRVAPTRQVNHSARRPWFDTIAQLPPDDEAAYAEHQANLKNFQHPDRDTEEWPPEFWFTADHF